MLSIFSGIVIAIEVSLSVLYMNKLGYFDTIKNKFRKQNISDFTVQPNLKQLAI